MRTDIVTYNLLFHESWTLGIMKREYVPTVECQSGSIYIYKKYLPGHMTNDSIWDLSSTQSLIGQQIVYVHF